MKSIIYTLLGKKAKALSEEKQSPANSPEVKYPVDQLYAQVDKKKKVQEGTKLLYIASTVNIESIMHITKESQLAEVLPVDQLYARVDKTKKAKKDKECSSSQTVVDQLYAKVDKKKKDKEPTCSPETAVDQLYAKVHG